MTSPSPSPSPSAGTPCTVDDSLRLVGGFAADERAGIVDSLSRLDSRLRSFSPGTVELTLAVKDRDGLGQQTTLEARIAGIEPVIAVSQREEIGAALHEVCDEAIRQITDAKNQTEPRNNRRLRIGRRRRDRNS
jgi:hypothetical protein